VPGKDRVDDLWENRLFVPDDAVKERLLLIKLADEIGPHLILDGPCSMKIVAEVACSQITQSSR
jgi:hypothetical protein